MAHGGSKLNIMVNMYMYLHLGLNFGHIFMSGNFYWEFHFEILFFPTIHGEAYLPHPYNWSLGFLLS